MKMTTEQCARCTNMLGVTNTNPDRLCSACQHDLNPHIPTSRPYAEWIAALKPRIVREKPRIRIGVKDIIDTADMTILPVAYLVRCARELQRRRKEATDVLDQLNKLEGNKP